MKNTKYTRGQHMNKLDLTELNHFSGTINLYCTPLCKDFTYTDGIKFMADKYGMHWLLNDIAFKHLPKVRKKHPDWFYSVKLTQRKDSEMDLEFTDGNDFIIHKQHYGFVDLIFDKLNLFIQNGNGRSTLMLRSEY